MIDQPEFNKHGNRVERSFLAGADRYLFDFNECTPESGWLQVDTAEGASYFGYFCPNCRKYAVRIFCSHKHPN